MKMNKWTIGLAAVGVVSLSSVAQAQEDAAGAAPAGDAASSVEINGYISTSYQMTAGGHTGAPYANANTDNDAFSMDVIDLRIGSAKSTGDWATGFLVETWIGDGASLLGTDTDGDGSEELAVKQAYVEMNTPIAGLELKLGVFDTIIGYESHNPNENALHSRSWGFTIEPTIHTGLLASYQVSDNIGVKLGIANTPDARINQSGANAENKTLLAAVSMALPEGWWPWATADNPASIDLGLVSGKTTTNQTDGADRQQHNFYASADLPLPAGFALGLAFDLQKHSGADGANGAGAQNLRREDNTVLGAYLTKSITDDLHAVIRYEFADVPEYYAETADRRIAGSSTDGEARVFAGDKIQSLTVGLRYDLWDNVITRVEYRVDQGDALVNDGANQGINTSQQIIANVIYEF